MVTEVKAPPVVFSTANGNLISVADTDDTDVEVTLTATDGTLTLNGTTGLAFSNGDGSADTSMTFSGTLADVNAALDGLQVAFPGDESRRRALADLRERYGGVAVLKGSRTLVSSSSGAAWLCTSGNPGMASPGMGDVLTGIIAALLAQGLSPEDAAAVGVTAHAQAGDRAAAAGERGLIAGDLLAALRAVLNP